MCVCVYIHDIYIYTLVHIVHIYINVSTNIRDPLKGVVREVEIRLLWYVIQVSCLK